MNWSQNERRNYINSFIKDKAQAIKKVDIDFFNEDSFILDEYQAAIMNAVKLFLLTRKGDRIRNVSYGGFFDKILSNYDMTAEGAQAVEADLKKELINYFGTSLIIEDVQATPDPVKEEWAIGVSVLDPESKMEIDASTNTIVINKKHQGEGFRPSAV